ncbi:Pao retrotransposon peptidase family protein, partial [Aphelenchoides avenae]
MDRPNSSRNTPSRPCIFCGGPHFDSYCSVAATLEQRLQVAFERGIKCLRCFGGSHYADACVSAFRGCYHCHSQEHNAAFCQKAIDNQPSWWQRNACAFCDGHHMDVDCTQYATASERTLQAEHRGRCLGCLGFNHSVDKCPVPPNKCLHCHHLALLTARSDVSPYHHVTLCPVKFPKTERAINVLAASGPQAAIASNGQSTSERMDPDELTVRNNEILRGNRLKDLLEATRRREEQPECRAQGYRSGELAVRERDAAVKLREGELAAEESRIAEERERLEKDKKQQVNLEKHLIDREKKLCEEEARFHAEKAAFTEQQLQAGLSSTLA